MVFFSFQDNDSVKIILGNKCEKYWMLAEARILKRVVKGL